MNMAAWYSMAMVAPIVCLGVYQYFRSDAHIVAVSYEAALDGAKLLREWCTWLATICAASIGAIAVVGKGDCVVHYSYPNASAVGVVAFGLAIVFTATLLGLPVNVWVLLG